MCIMSRNYTKMSLVTMGVSLILIVICISNISATKYMMCVMKIIGKKFCFRIAVNDLGILPDVFIPGYRLLG